MDFEFKIQALLLLGGNIGDVKRTFVQAIEQLGKIGYIHKVSSLYISPSWGFVSNDFLNQAVILETKLSPQSLLIEILNIEKKLGRVRAGNVYQARLIDIDIILLKDIVVNTSDLKVPHPKMHERKFVLVPCNEIAAEWIHPNFKSNVKELLNKCTDTSAIIKIDE